MSRFFMALTALFAFGFTGTLPVGELVAQVQQQSESSINGTITELDENELTLRTDDQRSITVMLNEQTRFLGDAGRSVGLQEDELLRLLDSGDRIVVNYRTGQEGEHTAVSVEKWTAERHEAQAAVSGQDQQRQVTQRQDLRQTQTSQTQTSQTQNSIAGTITDVAANRVTMRTDDQQSMTVRVDEQTRILDERGQTVAARAGNLLGNLDSGDQVVVNFRPGDSATDRIAVSIERSAPAAQQRQVTQQGQEQRTQQQLQRQEELPRTSSALPLMAFLGLIGMVGAGALSVAARRGH